MLNIQIPDFITEKHNIYYSLTYWQRSRIFRPHSLDKQPGWYSYIVLEPSDSPGISKQKSERFSHKNPVMAITGAYYKLQVKEDGDSIDDWVFYNLIKNSNGPKTPVKIDIPDVITTNFDYEIKVETQGHYINDPKGTGKNSCISKQAGYNLKNKYNVNLWLKPLPAVSDYNLIFWADTRGNDLKKLIELAYNNAEYENNKECIRAKTAIKEYKQQQLVLF